MADADLTIVKSEPLPDLTIADDPSRAASPPSRWGLTTSPLAPEFARAQADLSEASHPGLTTPVWRARLRGLIGGMASGALNVGESATVPASLALAAAGAGALKIPAVSALAHAPISPSGVTRAVGRGLQEIELTKPVKPVGQLLEWLASEPTAPAKAGAVPRLVKGPVPTVHEVLGAIVDELRAPAASPRPPAISGAAPGGAQAATDTMRQLADQPPMAQRLATPPSTPLTTPVTPQEAIVEQAAQQRRGGGMAPSVAPGGIQTPPPTAFDLAAKKQGMAQPRPVTPVPLKAAVNAVQQSATAAKVKLTADQFNAATQMVKLGHDPAEVMQAMTVLHELQASSSFANLPTDAEMAKDVVARNATGKWGAGPVR